MTARACYAIAMSGTGLHEQARQEMSIVLSWKPSFVEGYVVRAVSAAEMGAARQANTIWRSRANSTRKQNSR